MKLNAKIISIIAAASFLPGIAFAAEPASCKSVKFADVGWTDITATTATASVILKGLGYEPHTDVLAVPVTYTALNNKQIDVFLGNWMPTMEADRKAYVDDKSVVVSGAIRRYPGGRSVGPIDIDVRAGEVLALMGSNGAGKSNDGNRLILDMIKDNKFDLKGFELVESSEQGMLAQVEKASGKNDPIVFLGWEPHPMNTKFKISYLSDGDDVFGPNFGGATVYTNTRANFTKDCPNAGTLIKNLTFTLTMENQIMGSILFDGMEGEKAATTWLKANPGALDGWLKDVTTLDGKPGLDAVKKSIGL